VTSPVDICNQSLDQIRSGVTVQSINPSDGSLAGDVMSRNYQTRVDAVSRAAQWNCLRFQQPLTLLRARAGTYFNPTGSASANPPSPWLFEYAWPTAPFCLRMRYLFPFPPASGVSTGPIISLPSTPLTTGGIPFFPNGQSGRVLSAPFAPSIDYDPSGNMIKVLLTNAPYAIGVYTARVVDPTLWDPQFTDGVVMTLAAWTAEPITGSSAMVKEKSQLAASIIMSARISDGDEGTQTSDHVPDWIRIRGSGAPLGLTVPNDSAWDSLSLPIGAI
jgi:hypothetical protein